MKEIGLSELKEIELKLLKYVHEICMENHFRYSLAYGTLLGAVRHKGFIPWDDDIDICMPRPDYDKFVQYCSSHKVPFQLLSVENNRSYGDLIAKVYERNTVIKEENTNRFDKKIGVYMDIFPIEGLGNTYHEGYHNFLKSLFARELLNAAQWKKYFRSKTHAWYYEPIRFFFYVISRMVSPYKLIDKINRIYKGLEYDKMKFVGVVSSSYRKKDIFEKKNLNCYTQIPFENEMFQVFKEYDLYLKQIYGDYLKLPPMEERNTHHTFKAYYLSRTEIIAERNPSLTDCRDANS